MEKRAIYVKRASGMSLIELTVAIGIMTVILWSMSTMIYQFLRAQTEITSRDEVNDFAASLTHQLNFGNTCSVLMTGKPLMNGAAAVEPFHPLTLANWGLPTHLPGPAAAIKADTMITPKLKILFLGMMHKPGAVPEPFSASAAGVPVIKYRTLAQLKLVMSILHGDGSAKYLPPRYFDVPVILPSAVVPANIEGCRVDNSLKAVCEATGVAGAWDPATQTCNLEKKKCQTAGYFTAYNFVVVGKPPNPLYADPTAEVNNPLTGAQNCPQVGAPPVWSVPYLTGTRDWVTNPSCGKKCTDTVEHRVRYFMCMYCP